MQSFISCTPAAGGRDIFTANLTRALRGGLILSVAALFWRPLGHANNDQFLELGFVWLSTTWLTFPAGALLGYLLPRLVLRRGWGYTLGIAILAGILIGLALTAGAWLTRSHLDLIGLITNRHGGGYESYSFSVRRQLREQALDALRGIAPVTVIWIAVWTIWIKDSLRTRPQPSGTTERSPGISITLDRRLVWVVGWVAAGVSLFATALLFATFLFSRGGSVPLSSFFAVAFGSFGLVLLGPFLGPLATGWVFHVAIRYAAVGVPALLAALAPFVFCRQPVRPATAVVAWCGFITALLFWVAIGLFSLGHCLG